MTYDPIIAWCRHRQQSTTDKAALEELRMIVTLCEGLDRQDAFVREKVNATVAAWGENVRLNPPKRVTDFRSLGGE